MVFAKRFLHSGSSNNFIFVLAVQALAVSIDGSVSPDEVRGTNDAEYSAKTKTAATASARSLHITPKQRKARFMLR